jgi:hypothetical protein
MLIQFRGGHLQQVFTLEQGLTIDMTILCQQAQDGHYRLGFTRARLANQAQRVTSVYREAQVINRVYLAFGCIKADIQVLYLQ